MDGDLSVEAARVESLLPAGRLKVRTARGETLEVYVPGAVRARLARLRPGTAVYVRRAGEAPGRGRLVGLSREDMQDESTQQR